VTADVAGEEAGVKSRTAFRTISEVAEELGVAPHVLRFWESKFSQIRPLKRGGGRRYYRPEDVETLREIKTLLYEEGYTIKGAQKHLRARRRAPVAEEAEAATAAAPKAPLQERLTASAARLRALADRLRQLLEEGRAAGGEG